MRYRASSLWTTQPLSSPLFLSARSGADKLLIREGKLIANQLETESLSKGSSPSNGSHKGTNRSDLRVLGSQNYATSLVHFSTATIVERGAS
ncbi:hypothetical protein PROFUN_03403 [Planoprotostelium fungivorum]|uniref:Uncharacterized protein n=1 Tax=Planoprotostelium fungivorum TaxID=1890364 RepID=A0A2P6NWF5_9EUKA|nr:hypothetical protein PROFUN_03403 [Planoprotostelium fungivorum]